MRYSTATNPTFSWQVKHTFTHTHLEVSVVPPSYIFTCKCTGEKCRHQPQEFCSWTFCVAMFPQKQTSTHPEQVTKVTNMCPHSQSSLRVWSTKASETYKITHKPSTPINVRWYERHKRLQLKQHPHTKQIQNLFNLDINEYIENNYKN